MQDGLRRQAIQHIACDLLHEWIFASQPVGPFGATSREHSASTGVDSHRRRAMPEVMLVLRVAEQTFRGELQIGIPKPGGRGRENLEPLRRPIAMRRHGNTVFQREFTAVAFVTDDLVFRAEDVAPLSYKQGPPQLLYAL